MGGLNNDWLSQLAPAHAPAPVGWWPPAPGWWGVALVLAGIVAALAYFLNRPPIRLRRLALRELKRLETALIDDACFAAEAERLLRRYAVSVYGRAAVAGLSGRNWLEFLARHGAAGLAGGQGEAMLRAAYGGEAVIERRLLLNGVRAFIRGRA